MLAMSRAPSLVEGDDFAAVRSRESRRPPIRAAGRRVSPFEPMATRATADERAARGRAARTAVPRSSHGVYEAAPERGDPIGILEAQAATRVPELVPIRYGRMLSSPFAFFRGAAAIMASDLAETPLSGFDVQCCGDAHLSNFGLFASPERRL